MTATDGFHVRTGTFEGPLDLLLLLIEKRKFHIHDVSLSAIADEYLSYIEKLKEFPTKDAAHFLVVASTLVLIKSRSLLPGLSLSEEEEASISDLEARLTLLARTRALAATIRKRFSGCTRRLFFREADSAMPPVFSPGHLVKISAIRGIMRELLENLPTKEFMPQIILRKTVSMEEMMNNLTVRIKRALSVSFREFATNGGGDKVKIIIGFLALLELVKRGIISVKQNERLEDIEIEGREVEVPRYY